MARNETQPIAVPSKPAPPATSWWTDHRADWAAWYDRARAEWPRMIGSPEAKLVRLVIIADW